MGVITPIPKWMAEWIEKFESVFDRKILLEPGVGCPTMIEFAGIGPGAFESVPSDTIKPCTREMELHHFRAYSPPFSNIDAACAYVMGYLAGGNLMKIVDKANKSKVRVELLYRFPLSIEQQIDFMTRQEQYLAGVRFTVAVGMMPLDKTM